MNSNEYIQRLNTDLSNQPIDDVVKHFTQFLHDKAFDVFGKTYHSKSSNSRSKKPVNKEWFNANCINAKREFTSARNLFNRDKNDQTRLNFTRARTRNNRVKKKAKQNHKIKEGRRINDLAKTEPRKFWKNVKKSYKKTTAEADSSNVEDMHDHFENMFGEQSHNDDNIEPELNQNYCKELDMEFTEAELRSAVFSQNNNNLPGIDNIPTEIFKASYEFISPFLLNLYNRMYNTGEYPRS